MFKRLAQIIPLALVAAVVMTGPARVQTTVPGQRIVPLGYQQLTSLGSAVGLSPPAGATAAYIVPTGSVRYRDDGTAPTAALGVVLPTAGIWYVGNLSGIQFIATTGSPTVDVLFYR